MFQDEGRFGRINDPRRCWACHPYRPQVPAQLVRAYLYAFSAVSPHDGVLDSLILPAVNADAMSLFLAEVAARHPDEEVLIVLDGAGWHGAHHLVVPPNLHLLALPPYSPELNPAEHLWDEIREKWFRNEVFHSLDAVEQRLTDGLVTLEAAQSRVQTLTGFPWIVSIPLLAN